MAGAEGKAALIGAPRIGAFNGFTTKGAIGGIGIIACTGASQAIAIPNDFWGLMCAVRPIGCSVEIGFSDIVMPGPTILTHQPSPFGNTHPQAAFPLPIDTREDWIIPAGSQTLAWLASTGVNAWLAIYVAEILAMNR